ncbi:hypothetical protein BPAE_0028g00540 [Botrytis paeoniae]|uniref:Uncharacterized protein n=1 Tax=Botrytis paeoniae TaxID=278948 RepID=A0A4Z1FV56_9HELO|nr:hypothetical protein BPAE_0028g00540 [Botrytis paeoniae]
MKGLRSTTVQRSDKLKDGMRKTKGNCTEMVTYRTTFLVALSKKHRDTQSQMPNVGPFNQSLRPSRLANN